MPNERLVRKVVMRPRRGGAIMVPSAEFEPANHTAAPAPSSKEPKLSRRELEPKTVSELTKIIAENNITPPSSGRGKDGGVLKDDLIDAILENE